jgi:hypothetical protein
VQLTPEDIQKLETKQIANVIRKLNSGKTLTARDEALLSRAKATPPAAVQTSEPAPPAPPPPILSGFAKTWDELAQILSVDRRTLTNLRQRYGKECPKDQADGRKEIAPWAAFLGEKGVQGRGVNNPELDFLDERKLRLEERKLRVDRERYELEARAGRARAASRTSRPRSGPRSPHSIRRSKACPIASPPASPKRTRTSC